MTMADLQPARAVVLSAARACLRRWPFVLFWLGVLPCVWSGILALLPTHNLSGASLDVAYLLWVSLAVPVEITIALDILRERPTRWSTLPRALRFVPRVSTAYTVLAIPFLLGTACSELAQRESFRSYASVLTAVGVACMAGTALACLRLLAWIPTIVDEDRSLVASLRVARQVARGRGAWVLRVSLCLVAPLFVAVGLTGRFPRFGHLAWCVTAPWITLVWVAAYLRLRESSGLDRLPESGAPGSLPAHRPLR